MSDLTYFQNPVYLQCFCVFEILVRLAKTDINGVCSTSQINCSAYFSMDLSREDRQPYNFYMYFMSGLRYSAVEAQLMRSTLISWRPLIRYPMPDSRRNSNHTELEETCSNGFPVSRQDVDKEYMLGRPPLSGQLSPVVYPQGSVLGPILFAIYINDLPDALKNSSTAIMYADDTKVYWRTDTTNGQQLLQEDLDALYNWSEKWQLRFHPDKCKVLPLGNRPPESKPKLHLYTRDDNGTLRDASLEETISEKDIGVSVNNKLSFREQIDTKTTKANTAMGIIRRTFDHLDKHTFMLLYRSMVRPHLKVSNSVWIPHQKQDIEAIEQVQKRATKYIPGFKDLLYEQRLRLLGLPTPTYRRVRGDMIETDKILTGVYDAEVVPDPPKGNEKTKGHNKKLFKRRATNLNCRKQFFALSIASVWNGLPDNVVNAPNINCFKWCLNKHWRDHPSKYDYLEKPYSHLSWC